MPKLLRRAGWLVAFGLLANRARKGLARLDEPLPKDKPAVWPPLAFERAEGADRP